jgi:hypothetical protein
VCPETCILECQIQSSHRHRDLPVASRPATRSPLASPRAAVESPVWDGEFDDDGGENGVFCGEHFVGENGIPRKLGGWGRGSGSGAEHVTLEVEADSAERASRDDQSNSFVLKTRNIP